MDELITTIPESGRVPSGENNTLPAPPEPLDRRKMVALMIRALHPQMMKSQIPADLDGPPQPTMQSQR